MCLAIPVRVIALLQDGRALVDVGGNQREISLALVPDAREGDYVLLHVGYALVRLDADDAVKTLKLYNEMTAG